MSEFVTDSLKNCKISKISESPLFKSKISRSKKFFDPSFYDGKLWEAYAVSRGRELKIVLTSGEDTGSIKIGIAKIGTFNFFEPHEIDENFDKKAMLRFHLTDGRIFAFCDFTKLSRWYPGSWSNDRGPDILTNHNEWRDLLYQKRNIEFFKNPIFEVIVHKKFFNGIGNFCRSEILCRTRFSPFTPFNEVLENDVLRDDFFDITRYVLSEVKRLGGLQYAHWKNPFGQSNNQMKKWVRCYNKLPKTFYLVDSRGKLFWFQKKWLRDYGRWAVDKEVQDTRLLEKIYRKIKKDLNKKP